MNSTQNDDIETWLNKINVDTGDIILFDRDCNNLGVYGGVICHCAKLFGRTTWDHVGVIIKDPETNELFFLEASLSGVKLRSLKDRIAKSKSNEICVRKLHVTRDEKFHEKVKEFTSSMLNIPYEDRVWRIFSAGIYVPSRVERERLSKLISRKEDDILKIQQELQTRKRMHPKEQLALKTHLESLDVERLNNLRLLKETEPSIFENTKDESAVFCSQLVASLYQTLGILSSYPPSNAYTPKDFSNENELPFTNSCIFLLPHVSIKKNSFVPDANHTNNIQANTPEQQKLLIECLRKHSLFSHLSQEELIKISLDFERKSYQSGDIIFFQGTEGLYFYVIEKGECDAFISDQNKPSSHLVATFKNGNAFGDSSLVYGKLRRSTFRARSTEEKNNLSSKQDEVILWRLDKKMFRKHCKQNINKKLNQSQKKIVNELLSSHYLFQSLNKESKQALIDSFFTIDIPSYSDIIRQGQHGDNFYMIESGSCEIYRQKPNEKEMKAGTLIKGNAFGDIGILYNSPVDETYRTSQNGCKLLCIDRLTFLSTIKSGSPSIYRLFCKQSSVKLNDQMFLSREDFDKAVNYNSKTIQEKRKHALDTAFCLLSSDGFDNISFSEFIKFHTMLANNHLENIVLPTVYQTLLQYSQKTKYTFTYGDICIGLNNWLESRGYSKEMNHIIESEIITHFHDDIQASTLMDKNSFQELMKKILSQQPIDLLFHSIQEDLTELKVIWEAGDLIVSKPDILISSDVLPVGIERTRIHVVGSSVPVALSTFAAIASRTLTAPLERLKILRQIHVGNKYPNVSGLIPGLQNLYQHGGIRNLFVGNGAHCLKVFPSFPLKILIFNFYRDGFNQFTLKYNRSIPLELRNFLSGGFIGFAVNGVMYPFDFVRGRLSAQNALSNPPKYSGIIDCFQKVYKEEGIARFYRGFTVSSLGSFWYLGLNYSLYEFLRPSLVLRPTEASEVHQPSFLGQLTCGCISSIISQTAAYPFDLIHRRLQVDSNWQKDYAYPKYINGWDCVRKSIQTNGIRDLYQGIGINSVKVIPFSIFSFSLYELLRDSTRFE